MDADDDQVGVWRAYVLMQGKGRVEMKGEHALMELVLGTLSMFSCREGEKLSPPQENFLKKEIKKEKKFKKNRKELFLFFFFFVKVNFLETLN